MEINATNVDYTIETHTRQFDPPCCPPELSAGETYRLPSGVEADGRELDGFARLMGRAGLTGEFLSTADGWEYFRLVEEKL